MYISTFGTSYYHILYHQEPYIIQPGAYGVYIKVLDTTKQQQKQIYRLRNVCMGYVLYRTLVSIVT